MPVITAGIIFRKGFVLNDKNDFREGGQDVSQGKKLQSECDDIPEWAEDRWGDDDDDDDD